MDREKIEAENERWIDLSSMKGGVKS